MFQIKFLESICTYGPDRGDLVSHIWHEVLQRGLLLEQSVAKSSFHTLVLLQSNSDLLLGLQEVDL